jgi:hypothetical protein
MHQSLCNPPKSPLLAAIRRGFLHGAPRLDLKSVAKYLPPSMAMAKGHLKRPKNGIRSTTPKRPRIIPVPASVPDILMPGLEEAAAVDDDDISDLDPCFHLINNIDDHSLVGNSDFGFRFPGTAGIRNSASEFGIPELSGGNSNRKT